MILILRRIAKNASDQEIIDFLEPALKGNFLKKTGQIESINRLVLKDNRRKTIEYHALVAIDSDATAKRAIKKLHRKPFKNRVIIVREYFYRSWHNDPRVNMHQWNEELVDKRKGNRRRRRLEVVNEESIKFSQGEDDFRAL
ncbi:MAG: RNA-binding protein [Methylococcales bacterium]